MRCLTSSARLALVGEDVIARVVFARARLVVAGARFINSWLVTPMGLVDVTLRYRFRAAGLSTVVMPERRMPACVPKGRGLVGAFST